MEAAEASSRGVKMISSQVPALLMTDPHTCPREVAMSHVSSVAKRSHSKLFVANAAMRSPTRPQLKMASWHRDVWASQRAGKVWRHDGHGCERSRQRPCCGAQACWRRLRHRSRMPHPITRPLTLPPPDPCMLAGTGTADTARACTAQSGRMRQGEPAQPESGHEPHFRHDPTPKSHLK